MKIKISIIVPMYGVEKYIERCLKSLLNQTLKEIEIIIVDDGSQDKSLEIAKKFSKVDSRIKIYKKENEGLGLTRNFGISKANGEYIIFVDSDDFVDKNMCEILYNNIESNKSDVAFSNFYIYSNRKMEKKYIENNKILDSKTEIKKFILDLVGTVPKEKKDTNIAVSVWKGIYKLKIIKDNNIKFCSEKEYISEDLLFNIDYLNNVEKISLVSDFLYYYCVNFNSLSKTYKEDRFNYDIVMYFKLIEKLKKIGCSNSDIEERCGRFLIARSRVNVFAILKYKPQNYIKLLNNIANNDEIQKIYKRYDFKFFPFKYKIIFFLLVKKKFFILNVINTIKDRGA